MRKKYLICLISVGLLASFSYGAGTLTPIGSTHSPIQMIDHHVDITINNGFAQTTVTQTFHNPNPVDLEGLYVMPLPKSASLSEYTIYAGETEIHGEVLEKSKAQKIYKEEKNNGQNTGLAEKKGFQRFEFRVAKIPALTDTRIRFVYYQPLKIDTGVGRFLYPLEEGGTDEPGKSFWLPNNKVEGTFSARMELKSAWPLVDVRLPGREQESTVQQISEGHYIVELSSAQASLNKDLILYYRLSDNLPGRVEVVPYRADKNSDGTFMMVVTPGLDLKPLENGSDYVFVLDTSGSMQTKIHTLARGIAKTIKGMKGNDRFRLVTFDSTARELTPSWVSATQENAQQWVNTVEKLSTQGSTNIYDGLQTAFAGLDNDRVTSVILVTDGVTNTGVIDPVQFHKLMKKVDVRVFSFVMGNSANWPLMNLVGKASGGFAKGVSNDDDIIGQILLAKSKIRHESLHHADLRISGVKTHSVPEINKKIYRGQQLVLFGRYQKGGKAAFTLKARLSGEDKTYSTEFTLPDIDTNNPELERLWALNRIEHIQIKTDAGLMPAQESQNAIRDLGVQYQIVTDETSMVVLSDQVFQKHNIKRRNQTRIAREHKAQSARRQAPIKNHRVDRKKPAFRLPSVSIGSGGGAVDPWTALLALSGLSWVLLKRKNRT